MLAWPPNMADEMLKQAVKAQTRETAPAAQALSGRANKAKSELSECKRELFKLQQQKK